MKAIILTAAGSIDNLRMEELATPFPKEDELLVQVKAISINPVDSKTRKGGALYGPIKEQGPVILGWDISGIVTSAGQNVTGFKTGDEVFGMVNFPGHGRAYAEYVTAPATHFAIKPANITYAEAAAATLAALTAWQALVQVAKLEKQQHVLVHAAAGGVGHFAVQIGKHLGARVTGTSSEENRAFLTGIGADAVVDYKSQDFAEVVDDVDVVLDSIGGDTTARSIHTLKRGGALVSIVGGVKEHLLSSIVEKEIKASNYLVHSSGKDMEELSSLLQRGIIKPTISHQFSFDEIQKAHQQIETGKTRGKVIIAM